MPCIELRIRKVRLLYLGQVVRHGPAQLHALLSASDRTTGAPLPWVALVLQDLSFVFQSCREKLDELGDPTGQLAASKWEQIIKKFPAEWKLLVDA
eukprot:1587202-Karenia_brevis.AAC.1